MFQTVVTLCTVTIIYSEQYEFVGVLIFSDFTFIFLTIYFKHKWTVRPGTLNLCFSIRLLQEDTIKLVTSTCQVDFV